MKKKPRPTVRGEVVVVRAYPIIEEAVIGGVRSGIYRAYKHAENGPDDAEVERIVPTISDYVMNALCEAVKFEGEDDDND